jgi:hypothetical protein
MRYLVLIRIDEELEVSPEESDAGPRVEEMDGRGVRLRRATA